jgi:hypothetical protein
VCLLKWLRDARHLKMAACLCLGGEVPGCLEYLFIFWLIKRGRGINYVFIT